MCQYFPTIAQYKAIIGKQREGQKGDTIELKHYYFIRYQHYFWILQWWLINLQCTYLKQYVSTCTILKICYNAVCP